MKFGPNDFISTGWKRREVGIWYGAWSADDWRKATLNDDLASELSAVADQKKLDWRVSASFVNTARRFTAISPQDWVFGYFDGQLHFARIIGELQSDIEHPLNQDGEIFKYRTISQEKSFRVGNLPDCFRLLPCAGRANIHEVHGTNQILVELLAKNRTEEEVKSEIASMPSRKWLNVLGPASWESLCLGYLILEEGFVPTGLATGGTLPVFDIVGRDRDGRRILAQCKKNLDLRPIDDVFLADSRTSMNGERYFYFAYGGCSGECPHNVRILDRSHIEQWFETAPQGHRYLAFLRN